MEKNNYSSSDIRVLKEMEHVQLNPSMYMGSTEKPTHLVEEAIDNALDEAQGGYVSIIAVNIDTKNNICAIIDDGRGVPLDNNIPIIISSKLFSGAKFQGKKTAYEIASGLHGIGLVAVNALSDYYVIEIYRNKRHGIFKFEEGKLKNKIIEPFDGDKPFSTKIQFKPSKKYFENLIPDLDRIRRRLSIASAQMDKKITFVLNIDNKREIFKLSLEDYFNVHVCQDGEEYTMLMGFEVCRNPEKFAVMMSYSISGNVSPRVLSSINLLPVDGGGTHVNCLYEILRDFFTTKGKKLRYRFQSLDCLVGLRAYIMLNLKEPKFSSQTKDKLTNRKVYFNKFVIQLRLQIEKYFSEHPTMLELLLRKFSEYRTRLDAKKIKAVSNGNRAATKFTKLRDCTSRNGELFIVEGDSASGGLITCRDPRKHAILPLRGKIPNVVNVKNIIKNKEVSEMIMSLGTGIGLEFDISKLKYSKIICATDADPDGSHIAVLITMIFAALVPEIITSKHYYILETPLYAFNEKKNFVSLWTDEDIRKAKDANKSIIRLKGLGELNPDQLKQVAINEKTRRLILVEMTKDIKRMSNLLGDAAEKRKLLEGIWENVSEITRVV